MRRRVLGAVELEDGDRDVLDGCRPAHRAGVALLALRANRVVSRSSLADRIWGERQPNTADNLVQGYVSRLRAALRRADAESAGTWIVTRASGYLLRVGRDDLDLLEFER